MKSPTIFPASSTRDHSVCPRGQPGIRTDDGIVTRRDIHASGAFGVRPYTSYVYVLWKSRTNTVALRSFTHRVRFSSARCCRLALRVAGENEYIYARASLFPACVTLRRITAASVSAGRRIRLKLTCKHFAAKVSPSSCSPGARHDVEPTIFTWHLWAYCWRPRLNAHVSRLNGEIPLPAFVQFRHERLLMRVV